MNQEQRLLIVNADDFGLSESVNAGVAQAHEYGIVSSASLMVDGPAAAGAIAYSKMHPELSLGLHVDLGSWVYRDGEWIESRHVVAVEDAQAVAREVVRQIHSFQTLAGRNPTHLDSHQHVHCTEPARSILLDLARHLNVPLRSFTAQIRYLGSFYGQTGKGEPLPDAVGIEALSSILVSLLEGITELACHPALGRNVGDLVYSEERLQELQTLCDSRIRMLVESEGIEIRSFATVGNSWWVSELK